MIEAFSTCAGPAALELGNEVSNYKIDDVMSCTLSTGTLDKNHTKRGTTVEP
jgi:hypothetical protein